MASDSLLNPPQWRDYWHLHNRALNGKRTINEAYKWLQDNFTGTESRTAISHQMYCHPHDTNIELDFRLNLKDAIKLGFGKDYSFERVFR